MLEGGIDQLFPELLKILLNPVPSSQFFAFPYFSRYVGLISEKQCRSRAQKSHKHFKLIKVKRGTVIYSCEDMAERGFIILNGCVQLLKKKSTRQKTQAFPNHILYNDEQKFNYLQQNFKIPRNKAQSLLNVFYQQKMMFKYLPFHTLFNNQDFGFGEMVRNTSRTHTAVALQETQLLVIDKNNFDQCLRDFHQKKETSLVSKLLAGCKQQLAEQMMPKMMSIMNTTLLLNFDKQDVIFNQTQYPTNIFFVIAGQIEVRKKVVLTVPKKFMKHEITDPIQKQVMIKVCRFQKGSFFGEQQIFSGRKNQNNTVACILNNSLILKIDHSIFLKCIGDFIAYEKMLIENAVYKKSHSDASYDKQYKKAYSSFISQYEAYDNRKKQKMLSNFINENQNKNLLFEAFAPQGVFFRDTFQKLQGFEEAQNSPNKSHSIKRFKKKSNLDTTNTGKHQNQTPKIPSKDENQIAQKMLFSPKRSVNMAEFYSDDLLNQEQNQSKLSSPVIKQSDTAKKSQKSLLKKQYKSIGKFQQIEKDQAIYKRVLIKNGLYPIDKTIDKSNAIKALVHHNFDQVVKQCITRKNQTLKRTSKQKQNQIIVQSFQRSVQSLRSKSVASHSFKYSRFTSPCKGTDQLRKRMHNLQSLASGRFSDLSQTRKKSVITKIQDCIGVNEKPKSSEISMRNSTSLHRLSAYPSSNRSPQKIVFLNHMMKPITYFNSTEL